MAFRAELAAEARLLEKELRLRVQRRVDGGRLPVALVSRVESGAEARICCVCDQPIAREFIEFAVVEPSRSACLSLGFHSSCYAVWQQECAHRIGSARAPGPLADSSVPHLTH